MQRRFSTGSGIGAVVAGVVATVVAGFGAPPASAIPRDCGNGAAVIVAGTNAPRNAEGLPTGGVTVIGKRYAAQGYQVTYVDYPTHLWPLGPTPYDEDVAIGKAATEKAVAGYQRRCPGKPVVVAGYSQGARIAGDVLAEAGTGKARRGISADGLSGELYSDPRRDGNDDGRGIENVLIGLIPGLTMSGPRPGGFGRVPVTQYCLEGDPICDLPSPVRRPVSALDGVVGYFTKHGYYPARMHKPVHDDRSWECTPDTVGHTSDCVVAAPPATVSAAHEHLDPRLAAAGLPGLPRVVEPALESVHRATSPGVPLPDVQVPGTQVPVAPVAGLEITVTPSVSVLDPVPPPGDTEPALLAVGLSVDVVVAPPVRELVVAAAAALESGRRAAPAEIGPAAL